MTLQALAMRSCADNAPNPSPPDPVGCSGSIGPTQLHEYLRCKILTDAMPVEHLWRGYYSIDGGAPVRVEWSDDTEGAARRSALAVAKRFIEQVGAGRQLGCLPADQFSNSLADYGLVP